MSYAIRNEIPIGASVTKQADNRTIMDSDGILSTVIGGGIDVTYDGIDKSTITVPEGYTTGDLVPSEIIPFFDIDKDKIIYVRAIKNNKMKTFKFEQLEKATSTTAYYGSNESSSADIDGLDALEQWLGMANPSSEDRLIIKSNTSGEITAVALTGIHTWKSCDLQIKTGEITTINPKFIPVDEDTITIKDGKLSVTNPVANHGAISSVQEGYYLVPDVDGDINNKWELASRDVLEGGVEETKGKLVTVGAVYNALGGEPLHKLKTKATTVIGAINELSEGLSIISLREEDLH